MQARPDGSDRALLAAANTVLGDGRDPRDVAGRAAPPSPTFVSGLSSPRGDTPAGSAHEDATASDASTGGATEAGSGRLGRYTLLRLLGQGGMGTVYTAYDELLDRRVAIKLLRTDRRGGQAHARMLREAKALAQISHPNVVPIYDVSASAGRIFIAMEYVQGCTLREWCARRREAGAPRRELLDMFIQAGRGLAAAHAEGLVHRDFKPDNVLVGDDGRARVVDFGLVTTRGAPGSAHPPADDAHATPPPAPVDLSLTDDGTILGTPTYMPPEQFNGAATDARSDQFSFCAALYEALCDVHPFASPSLAGLREAVLRGKLQPPAPERALPVWLAATLERGLAARPERRFASMDELLRRLEQDPVERRRRRLRAAALVALTAVAAVLLVLLAVDLRARWVRDQHERSAGLALASAEARIAEARAAGDPETARRVFAAFVDDPLHEGTAASAAAWLAEAARRDADGALDDARAGFARAYLRAQAPAQQLAALTGLAGLFRRQLQWDELDRLLTLVDREHPDGADAPELAALRVDAALGQRDFAAASARLGAGGDARVRALADALATASPTGYRDIRDVLVAGDELLLIEDGTPTAAVHRVRRDAALTPIQRVSLPGPLALTVVVPGDPLRVIVHAAPQNTLYAAGPDGLVAEHRWDGERPFVAAAADLDGDRTPELYVGTGTGLEILALTRDRDGAWQHEVVYTATDTLESAAHGLLPVDLDGDGRDELAATFTGWRAYDVRALRRDGRGPLRTVGRDKLGTVLGVAGLRGADGERLLVAKNLHLDANPLVFPPGRPYGEPEGLYLYAFDGERLTRRRHLALPLPADISAAWHWAPAVGDADGDGRDDVAIDFSRGGDLHTLLYLQRPDGEFTPAIVGHAQLLAFAQLDADPAHELIVNIADDGAPRVWALGVGDDRLPPVRDVAAPPPRLVDPDDPAWSRQWAHADDLRDLGLHSDAATAFEDLGRRARDPDLRAHALADAAALRERDGQDRAALALFVQAAATPDAAALAPGRVAAALQGQLRAHLRLGDLDAARATAAALLARDDLPASPALTALGAGDDLSRAALEQLHARLSGPGSARALLRFDAPLAAPWTIAEPLALRRESMTASLRVETAASGVLASIPVRWSGDLLELEADITVEQTEWSSELELYVVPESDLDGPRLAWLGVSTFGTSRGGAEVLRELQCEIAGRRLRVNHAPTIVATQTDRVIRFRLRVFASPLLTEIGCGLADLDHGADRTTRERRDAPLPAAGRHRLIVRVRNEAPAWVAARIHHIALRGLEVARDPDGGDLPRAAARRALTEGDPVAALAELDRAGPLDARERLWRAHALQQLGRVAEARPLWREALAADAAEPTLRSLLRAAPEVHGPLLRELAPERWLELSTAAWRNAATNHLDDARTQQALLAALSPLDPDALASAEPGPLGRAIDLLSWRGRLHLRVREPARARADLERALAWSDRMPADDPHHAQRWLLALDLASLAAAEHDLPRARDHVRAALATSATPTLVRDIIRARPELAALEP